MIQEVRARDLAQDPSDKGEYFTLGMLDDCRILSQGDQGAFELSTDEFQMTFSYILRNGKPYFTAVEIK